MLPLYTADHGALSTVNYSASIDATADTGALGYIVSGADAGKVWMQCTHTDVKEPSGAPTKMENATEPKKIHLPLLVHRYSTPLAILLTASGIITTSPVGWIRNACVALLIAGIAFNYAAIAWIRHVGKVETWFVQFRLWTNLTLNSLLVYFLGAFWEPAWMLLVFTPLATGVYGSKSKTVGMSLVSAAVLFAIHALRGDYSPIGWGLELARSAFILLMSLMVNELAREAASPAVL